MEVNISMVSPPPGVVWTPEQREAARHAQEEILARERERIKAFEAAETARIRAKYKPPTAPTPTPTPTEPTVFKTELRAADTERRYEIMGVPLTYAEYQSYQTTGRMPEWHYKHYPKVETAEEKWRRGAELTPGEQWGLGVMFTKKLAAGEELPREELAVIR